MGSVECWEPSCERRCHCQGVVQPVAVQSLGARALPQWPPGPPIEPMGDPPSLEDRSHSYGDPGSAAWAWASPQAEPRR
jgi:hypothetical protein